MQNPECYLNHSLNKSTTKQTFAFPRSKRFSEKYQKNDHMFTLPSTLARRSCSFGFGNKISIKNKSDNSPPPGTYQSMSQFNNKRRMNTISFSLGRQKVKFANFLGNAERVKKDPSPNSYRINQIYSRRGGRMAIKLPSQNDIRAKIKVPGPGTYNQDASQMKNSGSYILSNYRNSNNSPVFSPSRKRNETQTEHDLGPGQYRIGKQQFGKSLLSRFKNSISGSFSKQARHSLVDDSKKGFPGCKYQRFSEFGTNQK